MAELSPKQLLVALRKVRKWARQPSCITRTYEFDDFPSAVAFVNGVAVAAEKAQHHPDIDIRWNKVTLTLTTHDQGGLTDKDFALARQLDALAALS